MEAFCHAAPFGHLLTTLQAGNGSAQGDLLQDTDLAREPVKEPAKRWRNWWRAVDDHYDRCPFCGVEREIDAGEILVSHCGAWPSRDVAETKAFECLAETADAGFEVDDYLGAYPEGERP